eukprot:IDg5852t1
MCTVSGSLSVESIAQIDPDVPNVLRGEYMMTYVHALAFSRYRSLFVITTIETLPVAGATAIVKSMASLFAELYSCIKGVLAFLNSNNDDCYIPLPPVLLHSLVKIRIAQAYSAGTVGRCAIEDSATMLK